MQIYLTHRNRHKEAVKLGRQRNGLQMKEKENFPEEEQNEMEAGNLTDIKFTVMIIRMLNSIKRHSNHKIGIVRNKQCNI